ncbi:hypothetical protein VB712_08260 [Spirulina sp. CCNP1310]|uniref:hypothetical protein n=1 Tax=Spirulina sp. CCNP1310 TaxID=3110249 RepID=UPI002B216827|nr:hypothetical protein [Spirulina sp. CCNP1310]MEA5419222.1 hypothetical protein [Spirulina sp. CCNP1310]
MKPNLTTTLALTLGATLLTTTAHAQITITGGEIFFVENGNNAPNLSPVAGYLETAQGRIQSGNYTHAELVANPALFGNITAGAVPVLLRINGTPNWNSNTKNLLATGSAFTPNGPVLFTNIPVALNLTGIVDVSVGPQNVAGFTFNYVDRQTVTSGQFGTSGSISGTIGGASQTVSLAPGSFHFTDPFPAPVFNLEPNTTGITTTTFTTQDWEERTPLVPTPSPNANLRPNGIVSRIFPTLSLYQ